MSQVLLTLRRRPFIGSAAVLLIVAVSVSTFALSGGQIQVPATLEDFFIAGTQPEMIEHEILVSQLCVFCHGLSEFELQVGPNWKGSMMAQAARDPLFYACLTISNQDVANGGDICIRCHTPKGWLEGRSVPTDGSALIDADRDGVNCHTCHRMVDPVFKPGISPAEDEAILDDLQLAGLLPTSPGTGSMVIDPLDRRRGPFNLETPPPHAGVPDGLPRFLVSPFHQTSELCATCHDVSNPAYERQEDGTYALGPLDEPHPTGEQYDMFPIERTYSEWLNSEYPTGVDAEGRFGGNLPTTIVNTCQDCHMPDVDGNACVQGLNNPNVYPPRPDMPAHDFAGGNTWVRDAIPDLIAELWPNDPLISLEFLTARLQEGQQRSIEMLELAATLEAGQNGPRVDVTVINESGHKLPTGYPEGRRMWINVQFFDEQQKIVGERGMYNLLTADLVVQDTKVYEINLGLDEAVADATGLPVGVSFHFVLNNKVYKDNRIPPRGFTNAAYEVFGGAPVGAAYADGQYWDDTPYAIPEGAVSALVSLYYQTSAKEYIEFLRDENVTNDWGTRLYNLWEVHGKSTPVLMAAVNVKLIAFTPGDHDADGDTDAFDFAAFVDCFTGPEGGPYETGCEVFDFDFDLDIDYDDLAKLQREFTGSL